MELLIPIWRFFGSDSLGTIHVDAATKRREISQSLAFHVRECFFCSVSLFIIALLC